MTELSPAAARSLALRFALGRGLPIEVAEECAQEVLLRLHRRGAPLSWRTVRDCVATVARTMGRAEAREAQHDTTGATWRPAPPVVLLTIRDADRATRGLSPTEAAALRLRLEGEPLGSDTMRGGLWRARKKVRRKLLPEG